MTRTLVVWCPDWPLVAAGAADGPAAVVHANRVVACSPAARAEGVRRGMRRREAQACYPPLEVRALDPARDARVFEPVVAAIEVIAPGVEIIRPGLCALATRGPSRYFGGDQALAAKVVATVAEVGVTAHAGIAEGSFAATIAAQRPQQYRVPVTDHGQLGVAVGCVVPPGETAAFLAPLPLDHLDRPALTDLLRRLGLHTLGDLAALPADVVTARFGADGAIAHRLARGLEAQPLLARTPPPDLTVHIELDPPAQQIDIAAFAAKALADQLHEQLARLGLACKRLGIEVETEHAERLARRWRHDGTFTATAVAERVRWQLDGWLNGSAAHAPTGGLTLLRLVPEELVGAGDGQLRLWGTPAGQPDRVARALARVQGMLGPEAVLTAVPRGGVDPAERVELVAWDGATPPLPRTEDGPWPGRLPAPSPATTFTAPPAADVLDAAGRRVSVNGRRVISAAPARVVIAGHGAYAVTAWAGPWADDDYAWDPAARRRRVRFQVATADGNAWLLAVADGHWLAEARYD